MAWIPFKIRFEIIRFLTCLAHTFILIDSVCMRLAKPEWENEA